jgi:hypothetical protein
MKLTLTACSFAAFFAVVGPAFAQTGSMSSPMATPQGSMSQPMAGGQMSSGRMAPQPAKKQAKPHPTNAMASQPATNTGAAPH